MSYHFDITIEELNNRRQYLLSHLTKAEEKAYDIFNEFHIPVFMQHIIPPYIVDFLGKDIPFILEIDGDSHNNKDEYDDRRSAYLTHLGFYVYRIVNDEVTKNTIRTILSDHYNFYY